MKQPMRVHYRRINPRPRSSMLAGIAAATLFLAGEQAAAVGDGSSAMSMEMTVASSIAKGALEKVGDSAMGWVLGELGLSSGSGQKLDKEILQQLSAIESQLSAMQTTLDSVENGVIAVYKQEVMNEAQSLLNSLNTAVATIEPSWTVYRQMVKNHAGDSTQLAALATQMTSTVPSALDTIDQLLTANGSGATGLAEVYAQVISNAITTPTVGDAAYYTQLHDALAYYNQWRMNAILMLVEAYHYQALQDASGATPDTVCNAPTGTAVKLDCDLAGHYADRFFNPSSANPQSGVIYQLQLAGASVTNSAVVSLTVPVTNNGVPGVNTWLWSTTPSSEAAPPSFPNGKSIGFEWNPSFLEWKFDGMPSISAANGYQTWAAAIESDVTALLSAYSGTVGTALATTFPAVASEAYIALGSTPVGSYPMPPNGPQAKLITPVVFEPEASNQNCYVRFLITAAPTTAAIGCGSFILNGGSALHVEGYWGPYVNQSCNEFGQCIGGPIGWSLNGDASKTPQGKQWAVTGTAGCPTGQSATNAAGWLKPCGNDWVQQRYQSVLPTSSNFAALAAASARVAAVKSGSK